MTSASGIPTSSLENFRTSEAGKDHETHTDQRDSNNQALSARAKRAATEALEKTESVGITTVPFEIQLNILKYSDLKGIKALTLTSRAFSDLQNLEDLWSIKAAQQALKYNNISWFETVKSTEISKRNLKRNEFDISHLTAPVKLGCGETVQATYKNNRIAIQSQISENEIQVVVYDEQGNALIESTHFEPHFDSSPDLFLSNDRLIFAHAEKVIVEDFNTDESLYIPIEEGECFISASQCGSEVYLYSSTQKKVSIIKPFQDDPIDFIPLGEGFNFRYTVNDAISICPLYIALTNEKNITVIPLPLSTKKPSTYPPNTILTDNYAILHEFTEEGNGIILQVDDIKTMRTFRFPRPIKDEINMCFSTNDYLYIMCYRHLFYTDAASLELKEVNLTQSMEIVSVTDNGILICKNRAGQFHYFDPHSTEEKSIIPVPLLEAGCEVLFDNFSCISIQPSPDFHQSAILEISGKY